MRISQCVKSLEIPSSGILPFRRLELFVVFSRKRDKAASFLALFQSRRDGRARRDAVTRTRRASPAENY